MKKQIMGWWGGGESHYNVPLVEMGLCVDFREFSCVELIIGDWVLSLPLC